jgi:hypothetical protein
VARVLDEPYSQLPPLSWVAVQGYWMEAYLCKRERSVSRSVRTHQRDASKLRKETTTPQFSLLYTYNAGMWSYINVNNYPTRPPLIFGILHIQNKWSSGYGENRNVANMYGNKFIWQKATGWFLYWCIYYWPVNSCIYSFFHLAHLILSVQDFK